MKTINLDNQIIAIIDQHDHIGREDLDQYLSKPPHERPSVVEKYTVSIVIYDDQ